MVRKGLKAFVRYDSRNKIIPGSLVLTQRKPGIGDWVEIDTHISNFSTPISLTTYNRCFIRYDVRGDIIPGSLRISRSVPSIGNWIEIPITKQESTTTTTTVIP